MSICAVQAASHSALGVNVDTADRARHGAHRVTDCMKAVAASEASGVQVQPCIIQALRSCGVMVSPAARLASTWQAVHSVFVMGVPYHTTGRLVYAFHLPPEYVPRSRMNFSSSSADLDHGRPLYLTLAHPSNRSAIASHRFTHSEADAPGPALPSSPRPA